MKLRMVCKKNGKRNISCDPLVEQQLKLEPPNAINVLLHLPWQRN